VEARAEALANWFGFLAERGELDPRSAVNLVTPERLDLYVSAQRQRGNRNSTIAHRLEGLHAALRLIAPTHDFGFIRRPGGRSLSHALPFVPRHVVLQSDDDLVALALALFAKGLAGKSYAGGKTAIRDAALIGILATRAPRNRTLSRVELGRQLQKRGEGYWMSLEAADMKGDQPLGYALPDILTPVLKTYIEHVRPALGGNDTPLLWVGTRGRALSPAGLAKIIRRRTRARFGTGNGPQWFRKCLTTMAAMKTPEMVLDVCVMLGHSPTVSLKHYNAADAMMAAQRHDERISRLQDKTRLLAAQAFGRKGLASLQERQY
jgi:hypothetical protein